MAEFEIKGGAGPYEAAAIVAVFNRLMAEASAARSARPGLPRLPVWVRAYQGTDPDDPMPDYSPEYRGPTSH
jgi:hypothetical protein